MNDAHTPDAAALARRVADAMYAKDRAAQALGMTIRDVGPGTAELAMTVREDMLNGHDICHGGILFTFADTAFAYACNAYNRTTVAQHCTVSFLHPVKLGAKLLASATERARTGRNGVYDIRVTDETGHIVAEFRGNSRTIEGKIVDE